MRLLASEVVAGTRFGRLTATAGPSAGKVDRVRCVCDCGRRVRPRLARVLGGKLRSCGAFCPLDQGKAPPAKPKLKCECGNARSEDAEACDRCTWLDGSGAETALVSALRVLGEVATREALVAEMGCTERTFYRALAVLRESGRVRTAFPDIGDHIAPEEFRYVPAARDPAATRNKMRNHAARGGYYVHVGHQKSLQHGDGTAALHVLINTRRAA